MLRPLILSGRPIYSTTRLKICGNIVEYREYAKPFRLGSKVKPPSQKNIDTKVVKKADLQLDYAEASARRARATLIDRVNCNVFGWKNKNSRPYWPVFLTITFHQNLTNVKEANYEFTKFIRRFNYMVTGGTKESYLKYVAVIEFQKRGAAHFHIILFNCPYIKNGIDELKKIWPYIFKIEGIRNAKNVGRYVSKYIYKDFSRSTLDKNAKMYSASRGLHKPIVFYTYKFINPILRCLPKESIEKQQDSVSVEYFERMNYIRYNLKNYPDERQRMLDLIEQGV